MTDAQTTNRRILLLGPNGQVGWELVRSLQPLGDVVTAGRTSSSSSKALPIDLADADSICNVVRDVKPALIVNAAAYTAVDKCEEERDLAMRVNRDAPGVLAEEALKLGAALIHYSTDYVFDGTGDSPWKEDDPTAPINAYGETKLGGEEAIRSVGAAHAILRVSWVHGVHGANFVKTMLRLAADRPELTIVSDQVGAPTSARTIADATAQLLAQCQPDWTGELKERGGTIHLVCQGETNWCDYAQEIFRLARTRGLSLAVQNVKPIPTSDYPTPAARPLNSRMNCDRLEKRFGLTPPTWQTALEHVLEELIPADQRFIVTDDSRKKPQEGNAA